MAALHVSGVVLFGWLLQVVLSGSCPSLINCGDLGNISFPFTDTRHRDCGILVIHGCDDDEPGAQKTIKNNNKWFDIVKLEQLTITIKDDELRDFLLQRSCDTFNHNYTFTVSSPLAKISRLNHYVDVLRCNHALGAPPNNSVSNSAICRNETLYSMVDTDPSSSYSHLKGCSMVQLPTSSDMLFADLDPDDPFKHVTYEINIGIELSQNCFRCLYVNGGQCRVDNTGMFYCDQGNKSTKIRLIVTTVACVAGALGVLIFVGWFIRRRFYKKNPSYQIIEMFLNIHGHLAAKRYSYSEIKKATNSFRNKLGEGGYGSVYKGKLNDGSLVAVKVLSDSKGNGEEFINEVASISLTSHVNIVSLLGFCQEGSKRALIYKYMPNGSLEKFIYEDKDPHKLSLQLSCKTIYNTAIGIARGLEYLHRGCNTKILHFDIKPHNILIDEDFCPKISDFGLAKICQKKESIVSLLGTRGTAGYIAPEVFSRNFGVVSHKSDVYSYGMVVLEMVGAKMNNNDEVERSSEIYFPNWVYKRLELNEEPRLRSIKSESDREMIRKLIIVSLWCIQTDPSNRPAMSRVVDMMEGSLEVLQIPPKPYLSSPPRSPPSSSDHTTTYTSHTTYPSEY
ncbi:hypothetical protein VNO80_17059 [Phaseolus coccineus]|uniref:Protein kinase domain-containing protein n=1 Tax=Phaseolus coccineus TaxID=3886 RepID=A0AAN9MSS3_PHACN